MSGVAIKSVRLYADPFYPEWSGQKLLGQLKQSGFVVTSPDSDEKSHAIGYGFGAYTLFKEMESMPERFGRVILIAPEIKSSQPISFFQAVLFRLMGSGFIKKSASQFRIRSEDAFLGHWKEKLTQQAHPITGTSTLSFNGLAVFGDKDDRVDATVQENEIKRIAPAIKIEELHGAKHDLIETHISKIVEMILREIKN